MDSPIRQSKMPLDFVALCISEESVAKRKKIQDSPLSLKFGRYRIESQGDKIRYFLAKIVKGEVPKDGIDYDDVSSCLTFWENGVKYAMVEGPNIGRTIDGRLIRDRVKIPIAVMERHIEEEEVSRERWVN